MGKHEEGTRKPFKWRKAGSTAAVHGVGNGVLGMSATAASAWLLAEPISATAVLVIGGIYGAGSAAIAVAGEYVNHRLDDPVFDTRTTILFDLVGLTFGFLLFVIPAMQLEAALRTSNGTPGAFAFLTMLLTSFGVVILRGLLMNLGIVRDGENADRDRLSS